ncbi:translocation and assembly module lipoprotein TamL [Hymenobacter translucens]|uniref:translocation and assembly module lipoprotein TamL n=1 Tax=Hymenobacter translucens TaxID=2886507 RepID=UPI001D0E2C1E|nr:BamA/TamA family outer membrane protein [Hymenobacter translucens]
MPQRAFSNVKVAALLVLLVAGSCSPIKLLAPRQNLLSRIKLEGVRQADAERIQELYQQEPNTTFPLPKLAIYQLGHTFYNPERIQSRLQRIRTSYAQQIQAARPDSAKVGKLLVKRDKRTRRLRLALDKGNAIMRLGEPPVIYDSTLTDRTVEQISTFLRSKGFFRSKVTATDTVKDRRVTVTINVVENTPFTYSRLSYSFPDTAVAQVVRGSQATSLLHEGDRYDEEVIGQERARLETLFKNAGYFDFRQQYISLEADTSYAPATVRLRTFIAEPDSGIRHQVYTIRQVNFITDAGQVRFGAQRDTLVLDSVHYLAYEHRFRLRTLDRKLTVRPGQRYSQANTMLTQRQLANLDVFRFNNVSYAKPDSTVGLLDAYINASPTKRLQETTELGGTVVQNLPGPFFNFRLKVRNVFGGAEILEFGVRTGFEGQIKRTQEASELTTQLGANASLVLPMFLVPWRTDRFLTRYNPKTRLSTTYTYVKRQEYTRTNLEATYDYVWQQSPYKQYVLTPMNLSLVRASNISDAFQSTLDKLALQGSPLYRSFDSLFIPSMNLTSLYNSNDFNQTRDARYLRMFAEVGGLSRDLYRNLPWFNLKVYNFAKVNADWRRYQKFSPRTFLVYRLNAGVASALSRTGGAYTIPYDKYFFAGGASSLRAWRPRRLGPGSHTEVNSDGEQVFDLEQPGEILLEGNVEYRFPVYSFINGALFTDFGNVWLLHDDPKKPGGQFAPTTFLRQVAVGSGIGIRFDFTFLILRLDVATKVYDPTALGNKFRLGSFNLGTNQTAFNLGIGYPF